MFDNDTARTVFAYSEWLDGQGLIVGDAESGDLRTHEELVREFALESARPVAGARDD